MLAWMAAEYPHGSQGKSRSLEWVVPCFSGLVRCNVVSSVGLVDIYFTLKRETAQPPRPCAGSKRKRESIMECEPFPPYSRSAEQSGRPRSVELSRKQYRLQFRDAASSRGTASQQGV